VLTGGAAQIERLKASLRRWLEQLFAGRYDRGYVEARWQVGLKHAEIGLYQVYTNAALSRLRLRIQQALRQLPMSLEQMWATSDSVNKLLDLDLAIIEDSYEFHRMKQEMSAERERNERKFRNLVEAAACLIVILREDLTVAYFSPYAERLTGYTADSLLGRSFCEFFLDALEETADRNAWFGFVDQLPLSDRELPILSRDGTVRWLIWNMIRLEDFDGQPAVLAVGHDITEKRSSAERLLQAERLAAIGQTITGLAHESRNALQRINSCTEMLEFEVENHPTAIQLIRRSQQAQDDLTRLFDEVRNFAAPISLERAPCVINSVWREAWQLLSAERKGRSVDLQEQVETPEIIVNVDRFRLVQVFRNLFENSLAACLDPVQITIRAHCIDRTPVQAAALSERSHPVPNPRSGAAERREAWLEIRVADNGPGLDPRASSEVFEQFFTTKTKGTGLGMAIAQRILAAHGGAISVAESSTQGAEFVLVLPRNLT